MEAEDRHFRKRRDTVLNNTESISFAPARNDLTLDPRPYNPQSRALPSNIQRHSESGSSSGSSDSDETHIFNQNRSVPSTAKGEAFHESEALYKTIVEVEHLIDEALYDVRETPVGEHSRNGLVRSTVGSAYYSPHISRMSYSAPTESFPFHESIPHEIIVAYLYQKQLTNFWISDNPAIDEGAIMRASWNKYVSCPPALSGSPLAQACIGLNAQVSLFECTISLSLPKA
jgi:hypothetical protein